MPNDWEGSGAGGDHDVSVDCYDDEDCVTEGSGSGKLNAIDHDSDDEDVGSGDIENDDEDADTFEPVWPPWMNPSHSADKATHDITISDRTTMRPPPVIVTTGSGCVTAAAQLLTMCVTLVMLSLV